MGSTGKSACPLVSSGASVAPPLTAHQILMGRVNILTDEGGPLNGSCGVLWQPKGIFELDPDVAPLSNKHPLKTTAKV